MRRSQRTPHCLELNCLVLYFLRLLLRVFSFMLFLLCVFDYDSGKRFLGFLMLIFSCLMWSFMRLFFCGSLVLSILGLLLTYYRLYISLLLFLRLYSMRYIQSITMSHILLYGSYRIFQYLLNLRHRNNKLPWYHIIYKIKHIGLQFNLFPSHGVPSGDLII
jgi:hypothetical protein